MHSHNIIIMMQVSLSKADFDFTVRFYEFRNPLGLQCDECGTSGGLNVIFLLGQGYGMK